MRSVFVFILFTLSLQEQQQQQGSSISKYIKTPLSVPSSRGTSSTLDVFVPALGTSERRLTSPQDVYASVSLAYETVVEPQQAGLVDAKHSHLMQAPLRPQEAWHHFRAGRSGIVDSARFLITFSIIPSIQSGGSRLHVAAAQGLLEEMHKQIHDENVSPDLAKDDDGLTPLIFAVAMRQLLAVKLLLESGADVEKRGMNGATPLMVASAFGFDDIAEELIVNGGADARATHPFATSTALHFAAEMGRIEIVNLLCRDNQNDDGLALPLGRLRTSTGGTPLHTAADTNQSIVIRALVEKCNSSTTDLLNGDTQPLYMAAQRGFSEVVRELVSVGADINFVMPTGTISGALLDISKRRQQNNDHRDDGSDPLIPSEPGAFYADKNTKLGNGATALHAAVENNHPETVRIMVDELGALQLPSMEGASPLIIALQYHHPDIALTLLKTTKSDPIIDSKIPRDGQFALYVAALEGYEDVASEILLRGGKHSLRTRSGHTALSAAIDRGRTQIVKLLLHAGATVDDSSLIAAVSQKNLYLLQSLLIFRQQQDATTSGKTNSHSDHNEDEQHVVKTYSGKTNPLFAACIRGWHEGIDLLLKIRIFGSIESRVLDTNATCLLLAASGGHAEAVEMLLSKYKADPNVVASRALYSATPLLAASQKGNLETVSALLLAGADVSARMRGTDATSLYLAAERGHCHIVSKLLETTSGQSTVGWRVKGGATALQAAALGGYDKCLTSLVHFGAQIDSKDDSDFTALYNCAKSEFCPVSTMTLLLSLNASIHNTNGSNARSILSLVVDSKRTLPKKITLIKILLNNRARVYADALISAIRSYSKENNGESTNQQAILSSILNVKDGDLLHFNAIPLGLCAAAEMGGKSGAMSTLLLLEASFAHSRTDIDVRTLSVCYGGEKTPIDVARDARESDVLKTLIEWSPKTVV
jgi:ankyrin repeat protein